MLSIERHKQFIKDFSNCKISDKHFTKYILFIAKLIEQQELPPEAKDHSLDGEWSDFREFHISGDLLVIYKVDGNVLSLVRIGSHSQLFG